MQLSHPSAVRAKPAKYPSGRWSLENRVCHMPCSQTLELMIHSHDSGVGPCITSMTRMISQVFCQEEDGN